MRYNSILHGPPSPSGAGFIKTKAGPSKLNNDRLPTSQYHRVRKASTSTGTGSLPSFGSVAPPVKKAKAFQAPTEAAIIEVKSPVKSVTQNDNPALPQLKPWESYLHWLCLTEESGTLWSSSLCTTFHECLTANPSAGRESSSDYAARIDDIYWSFYLPLDPLLQFMEDRILSGYLLHVWTMFIELGKRIPHDDPAQDKLVELLESLVHLPPMEVRTWEGNDAPWTDLPTLDDALMTAWDDLYDPEVQMSNPESQWVNYFAFLGRLVAAEVTPEWWEIALETLREVLAEDVKPNYLTVYKTMALAEYLNYAGDAGDAFFEFCIDTGTLDVNNSMGIISPLMECPVKQNWYDKRHDDGCHSQSPVN